MLLKEESTTSPLALEVQAILRRYDDGDREESLREMKAVYERESATVHCGCVVRSDVAC